MKAPVKDSQGAVIGVQIIFWDVSERWIAEEGLRASEMRYRTLYDSSRDAIMILDPARGFTCGNPAALELFGCRTEQEFTSLAPTDLSPLDQPDGQKSAQKAREMISLALERGSNFFEWKHRRLDGVEFYATVLLTRMELEGRQLLQATVRDVTEQRLAAEALRAAKEAAEAASLAKSDFGTDEPRDPDTDERDYRLDRVGPGHPSGAVAARVPDDGSRRLGFVAGDHQRHSRFLEDRGGQAGTVSRSVPAARSRR